MKLLPVLLCIFLFATSKVFAHQFDGNWMFVKGEYKTTSGDIFHADNKELIAIKTVKGNKFALNNMKNGEFLGYLAGRFSIDGDHYSEHIEKGTSNEHQGKTFTFKGWLETKQENDQTVIYWHHNGIVNNTEETEVWQKIMP